MLVNIFKEPKEPTKTCKTLKLESNDGKALFQARSISRQNTQGSVATVRSFESTADQAFNRMQEKSATRSIKGLIIEFYESHGKKNRPPRFLVLLKNCNTDWDQIVTSFGENLGLKMSISAASTLVELAPQTPLESKREKLQCKMVQAFDFGLAAIGRQNIKIVPSGDVCQLKHLLQYEEPNRQHIQYQSYTIGEVDKNSSSNTSIPGPGGGGDEKHDVD